MKQNPFCLPVTLSLTKFILTISPYWENMQMMSPSVKSYGKPPTNIHALFLYWSCQDDLPPYLSSASLSFVTFFIFLKCNQMKINIFIKIHQFVHLTMEIDFLTLTDSFLLMYCCFLLEGMARKYLVSF